jgi:8-oxo-dGTP pyrophosphatase MutT (NUDIX family)
LGRTGAISIKRQRTQNRLDLAYVHHETDLNKLHEKFNEYLLDSSTTSLSNWLAGNPLIVKCAGFNILARGLWNPENIKVNYSGEFSAKITERISHFIDEKWNLAKCKAEETGQELFSSDLVRLKGFYESNNDLILNIGETTYKEYVGTNLHINEIGEIIESSQLLEYLSNPLATCAVVVSNDDKILIGRRSGKTVDYPNYYHVPGGHIEKRHIQSDNPNLSMAICDELQEEFAIYSSNIEWSVCTGLVEDSITKKPELTFIVKIKTDHNSTLNPINEEHTRLEWLDVTPESITEFLVENNLEIVPVGKACLMLFGTIRFGYEWFIATNDQMREAWSLRHAA